MCGIAGLFIKDPSAVKSKRGLEAMVDMLFLGIEKRGKMASGFVAVAEDGTVVVDKADMQARDFIKGRSDLPDNTKYVLLHTRLTTKGTEKDHKNNHPVIYNTCFTTHNGAVHNDDKLFEEYELPRRAEVDTEIISALMDKAEGELEGMKDYFSKMSGSIACAVIDPTRHPNRVVLARTTGTPLEWIEQDKFVMWASEIDIMRDAWGAILGTPPRRGKFKTAPIRTLYIVTDEGVEEHDIPFVHTFTSGTQNGNTEWASGTTTHGRGGQGLGALHRIRARNRLKDGPTTPLGDSSGTDSPGENGEVPVVGGYRVSMDEIRQATYAIRGEGMGLAKCMYDKYRYEFGVTIGPWPSCGCCYEKVHVNDIKVCSRGHFCLDCYANWMDLAAQKHAEAETEAEEIKEEVFSLNAKDFVEINKVFTAEERMNLDLWVSDEEFVHGEALKNLETFVRLDAGSIDWLLFRATADDIEATGNKDEIVEWINFVTEKYQQEYEALWEEYDCEMDGGREALTRRKALPPARIPHPPVTPPRQIVKRLLAEAKQSHGRNCAFCRKHHRRKITRAETNESVCYCTGHFEKCGMHGCDKPANHTRHDGIRVCHAHSRNTERVYADTVLRKEGYVVGAPSK